MDKIIIDGGRSLNGTVKISGAKNSALPLMAATLLTEEKVELKNIPDLHDINTMKRILNYMGVKVTNGWRKQKFFQAKSLKNTKAPYDLVRTMRASILVLGPLLARFGEAHVSLPGGCAIGARPVNLHIQALEQMGAKIKIENGYIEAKAKRLKGAKIIFDQVTVTGTENIMMAAVLANGETIIENAAREPEITDLANFLRKMGAEISGDGTAVIKIQGQKRLHAASHSVIPDRIEAGTFMIAAAMTKGNVTLENCDPSHFESLTEKLKSVGADITVEKNKVRVKGPKKLDSVDVVTDPYPGFATDCQAQFMAMMAIAGGSSVIKETIFENRFMHVSELNRMGSNLKIEGNSVFVTGVSKLQGAPVMATDLRASACLILAGLVAKGITEVHRVYHLDRGYQNIEKKLRKLGAKIKRAKVKY